jgi:hypothetical protein
VGQKPSVPLSLREVEGVISAKLSCTVETFDKQQHPDLMYFCMIKARHFFKVSCLAGVMLFPQRRFMDLWGIRWLANTLAKSCAVTCQTAKKRNFQSLYFVQFRIALNNTQI